VTFDLKDSGGETVLLFTHADWREPVEFMHHCSIKWATYLIGLRSGLEGGAFTAFPDDAGANTTEPTTRACATGAGRSRPAPNGMPGLLEHNECGGRP